VTVHQDAQWNTQKRRNEVQAVFITRPETLVRKLCLRGCWLPLRDSTNIRMSPEMRWRALHPHKLPL